MPRSLSTASGTWPPRCRWPGRRPDASAGNDRRDPASRLPADGRLLWV